MASTARKAASTKGAKSKAPAGKAPAKNAPTAKAPKSEVTFKTLDEALKAGVPFAKVRDQFGITGTEHWVRRYELGLVDETTKMGQWVKGLVERRAAKAKGDKPKAKSITEEIAESGVTKSAGPRKSKTTKVTPSKLKDAKTIDAVREAAAS
jgi:hypothetical protein